MFCTACGSQMKEGVQFCGSCGHAMTESADQARREAQVDETAATSSVNRNTPENEYVQKSKEIGSQFYKFALQMLKEPFRAGKSVTEADKVNGIISNVLLAFLLPLFTYLMARSFSSEWVEVPFDLLVLQPFFYLLLFIAIYTVVVFGVGKLMRADVSYMAVVAKFGALNILPVTLMLASVVFSILSLSTLGTLVFAASLILFGASSMTLVFLVHASKEDRRGLDVFYGLVITNVSMAIIYVLIGMSVMENIIEQINYGPLGMFF
ncbi:zinc-ribbon domain-containing protein [Halobacillus salinus]|uniref:zinc-ribbon domain-containing protein n=1 Tax=Halobacillus salinus TaxID=192814 RepID=UPI0009A6D142|nr:zinc-ribbon domain-containing protein [Halobacillus salinus]